MNGGREYSPLDPKQEFKRLQEKSTEFETSIGFPAYSRGIKECEYLDISYQDLKDMSLEELDGIAVDLSAYSVYTQRTLNKELSYLNWLKSKLDRAIALELPHLESVYGFEQKKLAAISRSEYASQLDNMRVSAQAKVDLLAQLPFQINQLVRVVLEVKHTKNGKTNNR